MAAHRRVECAVYIDTLQGYLPQAEIVKLNSPGDFFRQRSKELDALFLSAERGSAWTLIYPEFSVAVPQPDVLAAPVSMGMARNASSRRSTREGASAYTSPSTIRTKAIGEIRP